MIAKYVGFMGLVSELAGILTCSQLTLSTGFQRNLFLLMDIGQRHLDGPSNRVVNAVSPTTLSKSQS